jgi:Sulfotransferase family
MAPISERLFFMHIPKTGGSSLYEMLVKYFAPEEICPERHFEAVLIPPDEAARYRFFAAHTTYDLLFQLPEAKRIVTLFREPIERTISDYYYLRRHVSQNIDPRLARSMPLATYLNWPNRYFQERLNDKHAVFLCGHRHLNPEGAPWRDDEEIYDVGVERIETIDFVGICEYMPASVSNMWRTLGLPDSPQALTSNSRSDAEREKNAAEITADVLERIVAINQVDIRLYKYARARFLSNPQNRRFRLSLLSSLPLVDGRHATNDAGFLLFGPYIQLEPAKYICRFDIQGGDGTLDVIAHNGGAITTLAQNDVANGTTVEFVVPSRSMRLEFRLLTHGRVPVSAKPEVELEIV